MNLDEVADQHAWITVDSKNQVWIANSSEDKELKVNTRPVPPGGKPAMLYHNSIIFIEGRAFRYEEESCLQDRTGSDAAESPSENIVVDNSPVKERRPTPSAAAANQNNPSKSVEQTAVASPAARTKLSSSHDRSSNGENGSSGAKIGTKRTLAQSFDHVESSPSKRQKTDAAVVSRSAEIIASNGVTKHQLTTVHEERAADPAPQVSPTKMNPLHKVRFLLPGQATEHKSSSSNPNGSDHGANTSMSAPTSPVKAKSGTRIQNFDDSQNEGGSGAVWMRKMKKKLDSDEEEEDENGVTSSELDRISKGSTSPTKRSSKSPKKERTPKKEDKDKKKKSSTPSTSPQKKRARSPSPDSRSSEEESEEEERQSKSSKKKSASKDKKKDKKSPKDKASLQSKIRNIESSTMKSKSSKKRKNDESDDEAKKKSKSKHKSKKTKSPEKDRHQKKRSLRVRRSKKKVSLSSEESVSSEEYDYNSASEESSSESEESISSASSSDDFQESPKKTKSSTPKKRKVKESLESVSSEESDSEEEKRKLKSKKRKLQVEPVKSSKQSTSANHSPTKTKKKEPSNDSDISGEVHNESHNESRQSEEEGSHSRKEARRESFKAFLKPMALRKTPEVVPMNEEPEEKSEEIDAPISFPPNRPKATQTYSKKEKIETAAKPSTINLAPIKPPKPVDLEEEFEEQIEEEEHRDNGSEFVKIGKKVQFSERPPSPVPVDSASASYSSHSQSQNSRSTGIPSFLEVQNQGKSFVAVHGLPSQMTQRQSLYSPQLSQSPSGDLDGNAHAEEDGAAEAHEDKGDKMEVEQQEAPEIRSTPVPRQSQQGASMSLFSDAKEDEYDEPNNNNNNHEDKMEQDDDEDQSTLVVDRGDKSHTEEHEHEPNNAKSRDQSLTEIMEASTLNMDTVLDTPMQRQGSRSISKSKSSESVNTSLMSHEGNVSSNATNPLSVGSRSSNTAKLEEATHTTSTSMGAQTSAGSSYESLSIEEKIEFIKPKMKAEEVNSIDDLQKRVIVAFHELGCDEPQLLDDVIKAASELLPENYVVNTPNWQSDLASAVMPLVSNIIRSDVQYFKLKAQYRKSRQINEREHEQFDEQEEEQNEQQNENNFSFIPAKPGSLNVVANNNNNNNSKSHSSSSRSPSIPMQSIQSFESDQIDNVASIPLNAGAKFSQYFEAHEEPRDQMNVDENENNESANEDEQSERDLVSQKRAPSQTMSQNVKLVNYSNSESGHNYHSNDQEPRPSPSDEENSEQEQEKNSQKIMLRQKLSQKELETQHYSQNNQKSTIHSQGSRSGSQQSQPKLNESGSKIRSVTDQLRSELNKGMDILKSIVAKQKEPNAIRKWKRELGIQLRGNYLLCGGLNDHEVRILLQILLDELPDVNLEFIVSKLFSTAVVTIMLARNPGTKHEEVMQQVGHRCVALKVIGDNVPDWQLTDVLNKEG